jgi:hypothetical protein
MWEGTTTRLIAADKLYGEFYDFYSVSPKYFGYYHVYDGNRPVEPAYNDIGFMRNPVYNVRYSLMPIISTLLTIKFHYFVTTLVNNNVNNLHDAVTEFFCVCTRNVCNFLPGNTNCNTHDSILNRFLHHLRSKFADT